MLDPIPAEAAFAALDEVRAERDRYREALESIAATEAAMVPGRKWVHWRTQAEEALHNHA